MFDLNKMNLCNSSMSPELICRICLQQPKDETLMPTKADFAAEVERCTGLTLTQLTNWPSHICTSCALLLRAALKLRSLCEQSEKVLQTLKVETLDTQQDTMEQESNLSDCEQLEYLEAYEPLSDQDASTAAEDDTAAATQTLVLEAVTKPKRTQKLVGEACSNPNVLSHVCEICNNAYSQRVKLMAHMKVHSGRLPHECEICHKRFRQTPQLARHMNSHTGQRPYKCDYCESSFADPSTRIKHQRIHTNERPYKCQYCSKSFAYSNVLNVHLKVHTGERPFGCQYCGRHFSQLHHKNAHERTHVDVTVLVEEEL